MIYKALYIYIYNMYVKEYLDYLNNIHTIIDDTLLFSFKTVGAEISRSF